MVDERRIQRFLVCGELGAGATGAVVRAFDPRLEREVAIKILRGPTARVRDVLTAGETIDLRVNGARDDLLNEARMMARLSHPNVVPVYEVGLDGDAVFVVMEYVAGRDLRAWLAEAHSTEVLVDILAQAGRGLAAAHEQRIVHRDFKPENVLLGLDGRARVADFGISRMVAPASGRMQIVEIGGTPKYMAPELWLGAPATASSDVFAYCTVFVEAFGGTEQLRERGVSTQLRALVERGVSEVAADRPAMEEILHTIDGPSPRRRRRVLAASVIAAAAAVGVGIALASQTPGAAACEVEILAGRWDPPRREALQRTLALQRRATADGVARLIRDIDERAAELVTFQRSVCEAEQRGELAPAQVTTRRSCVERRAIELGALVQQLTTTKRWNLPAADDHLQAVSRPSMCEEIETPPILAPATTVALYDRWSRRNDGERTTAATILEELERDAAQHGEAELEVRAAIALAGALRVDDRLAASEAAAMRAYRRALETRDTDAIANALIERSTIAIAAGDTKVAQSYAQLALELAERPATSVATRARIYAALGWAEHQRADHAAAATKLRHALELLAGTGRTHARAAVGIRDRLVYALFALGTRSEAIALANENRELAKAAAGTSSTAYARTLDTLANVYRGTHEIARAIALRRESLAINVELFPDDHSVPILQRAELASDYSMIGDYARAHEEHQAAIARTYQNEALRRHRGRLLRAIAINEFNRGAHEEAMRVMGRAIEELAAEHGGDHPVTLRARNTLIDYQIDLEHIDQAEREIELLREGYQRRPLPNDWRPAQLRGTYVALVAIARGRPQAAARLAREALAELAERDAEGAVRRHVMLVLAESQVASEHYAEARATLAELAILTKQLEMPEDFVALEEFQLARAEYGLGMWREAIARATRARDVFARRGSQPKALREVTAFLASVR